MIVDQVLQNIPQDNYSSGIFRIKLNYQRIFNVKVLFLMYHIFLFISKTKTFVLLMFENKFFFCNLIKIYWKEIFTLYKV